MSWYESGLQFECQRCGNCCRGFLDESGKQIKFVYGDDGTLFDVKSNGDCIYLGVDFAGRGLCSIYDTRPAQCRSFPFWPENLKSPTTWEILAVDPKCQGINQGRLYKIDEIEATGVET